MVTTKSKKIIAARMLVVVAITFACALALHFYNSIYDQPLLSSLNYIFYDQKQKFLLDENSIDEKIIVVEIDDTSLMHLGRWPWPRNLTAELIETIMQRGPKKLVLDIVFAESSETAQDKALVEIIKKYSGKIIMGGYISGYSDVTNASHAKCLEDFIFTKKNNVVTDTWRKDKPLKPTFQKQLDALYESVMQQQLVLHEKISIFDFTDVQLTYVNAEYAKRTANFCASLEIPAMHFSRRLQIPNDILLNFEQLQNENPITGVFSVLPDSDGSIRRYHPSYPLLNFAIPTSSGLLADSPIKSDFFWINYSKETPLRISALNLMKNADITLADQVVFLGVTSPGVYDIRKTPIAPALPGTYILAQAASNILHSNFLLYWDWALLLSLIVFLSIFLQIFYLKNFISWKISVIIFSALLTGIATTEYFLLKYNLFFWSVELYICWLAAFIYNNYAYFIKERSQKHFIKTVFSKYIAEHVVEDLLKNPEKINLVGEKRNLTIFFSDIRNFTSISENLDPLKISRLLNIYFSPMVKIVKANNGTVDKFIGDGLMSFFGAPLESLHNSEEACLAALECLSAVTQINEVLRLELDINIQIGIGLNQQEVFVGNIGAEQLQSYTVIGDGVNLSARLQDLTKKYAEPIIVSESVFRTNQNKFNFRKLDIVKVKGRSEALTIYSLQNSNANLEKNNLFAELLNHFFNKDSQQTQIALKNFLQQYPSDTPAQIIQSRFEAIEKDAAPNWESYLYGSS